MSQVWRDEDVEDSLKCLTGVCPERVVLERTLRRTLAGLRSPWQMRLLCTYAIPAAIPLRTAIIGSQRRGILAEVKKPLFTALRKLPPLQNSCISATRLITLQRYMHTYTYIHLNACLCCCGWYSRAHGHACAYRRCHFSVLVFNMLTSCGFTPWQLLIRLSM
jgi:hypothetical protein